MRMRRAFYGLLDRIACLVEPGSAFDERGLFRDFLADWNSPGSTADALLLGDSVSLRVSKNDVQTETLRGMLAHAFKRQGFQPASMAYSAFNPAVYASAFGVLQKAAKKPAVCVIPINLRSFSPQWDFHPQYQFETWLKLCERFAGSRSLAARNTSREYRAMPVHYPLSAFRTIGEFTDVIASKPTAPAQVEERLRQLFIFHYTHPLSETHRHLSHLRWVIERAQAIRCRLVFYITPVNHAAGRKFVGETFAEAVRENAQRITRFLASLGARTLDLSTSLDSSAFFNATNSTEHLNESGRAFLLEAIENALWSKQATVA